MKTIALFGATGRTGSLFLERAIEKGFKLQVLVRDSERLKHKNAIDKVVAGSVLDQNDVNMTIENADIVVSLFGHVKGSPEWLQTNGTKHIISAMEKHNVGRIISLSGGGLPFPEKDQPKFMDRLIRGIMKIAVPKILNDAIAHVEVLKKSDKKWMVVRAPRLTNDSGKGSYKVGWVGVNASTKISRADLADFILTQVEDETFNFQMPFVSN